MGECRSLILSQNPHSNPIQEDLILSLFLTGGTGGVTVTADVPPTQTFTPMIHHQGAPCLQRSSPPPNFQNLSMYQE